MGSTISSDLTMAAQIPIALLAAFGLDGVPWPQQTTLVDNATFDYIVVGGGSAGCVVTRRLVEDKKDSVLMLEAGGDPPLPAMFAALFSLLPGSYVDYNYRSTKDDYAARSQNGYTMLTAGKTLGGSDTINHFLHTRGSPEDYDTWAELSNDTSWRYENVLRYFKKSERVVDEAINRRYGKYHGTTGPMGLTRQPDNTVNNYLKSFAEVGNPTVLDLNADKNIGYAQPQLMLADGKRQTPAYSYLEPCKNHPNLHVSKNTKVIKIIFENNVAVAVMAVYNGKTYTLRAKKEIIISSGVYNTPQLLMLSGIGPKEHLDLFNITVLNDLAVGSTLKDQVCVTLVYKLKKYLLSIPNPLNLPLDVTKVPFPIMVGSVALNKSNTCPDYQTYNLLFQHDLPLLTIACHIVFGLRNEICDRWQTQVTSRDSLYSLIALIQPESSGSVRLRSTDPFDDPLITTGYFTYKNDLESMLKYVKDFKTVGNTKYFKEIAAELAGLDLPECADKKRDSDEFWKCYILNHAGSPYHVTSTCPMGKVVDSRLKVKGMKGIRLVDASVIPLIPRGAPNAAVIMLAEKASDMIKEDNLQSCHD